MKPSRPIFAFLLVVEAFLLGGLILIRIRQRSLKTALDEISVHRILEAKKPIIQHHTAISLHGQPEASSTSSQTPVGRITAPLPSAKWVNAGRQTPAAALQTALWAANGGDLRTLQESIHLSPAARDNAAAILESLSATTRKNYQTPEELMTLLTAQAMNASDARILEQINDSPNRSELLVQLQNPDGAITKTTLVLNKEAFGWKLVVPSDAVLRLSASAGLTDQRAATTSN